VGWAGISGPLRRVFSIEKSAGPDAKKFLILEKPRRFSAAHARRNEFHTAKGNIARLRRHAIHRPHRSSTAPQAKDLFQGLGIGRSESFTNTTIRIFQQVARFATRRVFFDQKKHFGVDKLVGRFPAKKTDDLDEEGGKTDRAEFLAQTPLSAAAKADLKRLYADKEGLPAGHVVLGPQSFLLARTSLQGFSC
jgi:hypothetical protein